MGGIYASCRVTARIDSPVTGCSTRIIVLEIGTGVQVLSNFCLVSVMSRLKISVLFLIFLLFTVMLPSFLLFCFFFIIHFLHFLLHFSSLLIASFLFLCVLCLSILSSFLCLFLLHFLLEKYPQCKTFSELLQNHFKFCIFICSAGRLLETLIDWPILPVSEKCEHINACSSSFILHA